MRNTDIMWHHFNSILTPYCLISWPLPPFLVAFLFWRCLTPFDCTPTQFSFSQITVMSTPRPGATAAPERSLNRQVILDEDEYTEALSHIVARDFFPSLVHLDATNEYLDALHTQ